MAILKNKLTHASIVIETDDDFHLQIGKTTIYHKDKINVWSENGVPGVLKEIEKLLKESKVVWAGKCIVRRDDVIIQEVDYSDRWTRLQAYALEALEKQETEFYYGGNQTIHYFLDKE